MEHFHKKTTLIFRQSEGFSRFSSKRNLNYKQKRVISSWISRTKTTKSTNNCEAVPTTRTCSGIRSTVFLWTFAKLVRDGCLREPDNNERYIALAMAMSEKRKDLEPKRSALHGAATVGQSLLNFSRTVYKPNFGFVFHRVHWTPMCFGIQFKRLRHWEWRMRRCFSLWGRIWWKRMWFVTSIFVIFVINCQDFKNRGCSSSSFFQFDFWGCNYIADNVLRIIFLLGSFFDVRVGNSSDI